MAALALTLCLLYAVALFGIGEVAQRRRTGVAGWVRSSSSVERAANLLVLAAWLLDLLGPALVLAGVVEPWLEGAGVAGVALSCLSLGVAVVAQRAMGAAWGTGIHPDRPADLVTTGLFGLVRNPVYTTMIAASLGTWLIVPTAFGALGIVTCVVALEIMTRRVEEPHLHAQHGEEYERYAARVGRFIPGIGRLRARRQSRETSC